MKHPGIELAEKIKASGLRQVHLAQQLQVSPTSFNEMLKGKRPFPAALCVRMQEAMGFGVFSTSTRHMRQFPATDSRSW